MPEYDHGYKLLFSHPEMVRDLLLGFVREDWVDKLDMDSLERVAGSYVSDDLRERHDDIIWRVKFADKWLYVYLLLEFQSSVDPLMAVRIMTYMGLLYQDLAKADQITPAGKLPPILPIVLYNGKPRWSAPVDIFEMIENIPGSLAKFSPKLQYLLIDEGAYEQEELSSLKNLVASFFQMETSTSRAAVHRVAVSLINWLSDNSSLQRAIAVYINRVYFGNKIDVDEIYQNANNPNEVATMFDKKYEELRKEDTHRARAEGRHEERVQVAKRMLKAGMPISQVSEITELSEEEVQKLRDAVAH